jgi:hypothetical protein
MSEQTKPTNHDHIELDLDEVGQHDDVLGDVEAEEQRKRRKDLRRAVVGGLAGIAMLATPIVLANTLVGNDDSADAEISSAAISAMRDRSEANRTDAARAASLGSVMTTTTTAPPPPPTTTTTAPPTTTTTAPPETTTTEAPAPVDPAPDSGGSAPDPYSYATWDQLAQCESGGNWSINTGNGYYGGLQFSLGSWQGVGGTGLPSEASRETQITMGIRLYESGGWANWPACTRSLGWR